MSKYILNKVKKYIEETEEIKDGEWGTCRSLEKLIEDGDMPRLYFEILALLKKAGE